MDGKVQVPVNPTALMGLFAEDRWDAAERRRGGGVAFEVRTGPGGVPEYPRDVSCVVHYRLSSDPATSVGAEGGRAREHLIVSVTATSHEAELDSPVVLGCALPLRSAYPGPLSQFMLTVHADREYLVDELGNNVGTTRNGALVHDFTSPKALGYSNLNATFSLQASAVKWEVPKVDYTEAAAKKADTDLYGAVARTVFFKESVSLRHRNFELSFHAIRNFSHVRVKTNADTDSIIIAPQTGAQNAFHEPSFGCKMLEPGDSHALEFSVTPAFFTSM